MAEFMTEENMESFAFRNKMKREIEKEKNMNNCLAMTDETFTSKSERSRYRTFENYTFSDNF